MKRLAKKMDHRLSRSLPLLPPTPLSTACVRKALWPRWPGRGQPTRHYYIHGVRTILAGVHSYPNPFRFPRRLMVVGGGSGGALHKIIRTSSTAELSHTGVFSSFPSTSSTENLRALPRERRAVSCEDVSGGVACWDSGLSESGLSICGSRMELGSGSAVEEDMDTSSQCSFGSSIAFLEHEEHDGLEDARNACDSVCNSHRAVEQDKDSICQTSRDSSRSVGAQPRDCGVMFTLSGSSHSLECDDDRICRSVDSPCDRNSQTFENSVQTLKYDFNRSPRTLYSVCNGSPGSRYSHRDSYETADTQNEGQPLSVAREIDELPPYRHDSEEREHGHPVSNLGPLSFTDKAYSVSSPHLLSTSLIPLDRTKLPTSNHVPLCRVGEAENSVQVAHFPALLRNTETEEGGRQTAAVSQRSGSIVFQPGDIVCQERELAWQGEEQEKEGGMHRSLLDERAARKERAAGDSVRGGLTTGHGERRASLPLPSSPSLIISHGSFTDPQQLRSLVSLPPHPPQRPLSYHQHSLQQRRRLSYPLSSTAGTASGGGLRAWCGEQGPISQIAATDGGDSTGSGKAPEMQGESVGRCNEQQACSESPELARTDGVEGIVLKSRVLCDTTSIVDAEDNPSKNQSTHLKESCAAPDNEQSVGIKAAVETFHKQVSYANPGSVSVEDNADSDRDNGGYVLKFVVNRNSCGLEVDCTVQEKHFTSRGLKPGGKGDRNSSADEDGAKSDLQSQKNNGLLSQTSTLLNHSDDSDMSGGARERDRHVHEKQTLPPSLPVFIKSTRGGDQGILPYPFFREEDINTSISPVLTTSRRRENARQSCEVADEGDESYGDVGTDPQPSAADGQFDPVGHSDDLGSRDAPVTPHRSSLTSVDGRMGDYCGLTRPDWSSGSHIVDSGHVRGDAGFLSGRRNIDDRCRKVTSLCRNTGCRHADCRYGHVAFKVECDNIDPGRSIHSGWGCRNSCAYHATDYGDDEPPCGKLTGSDRVSLFLARVDETRREDRLRVKQEKEPDKEQDEEKKTEVEENISVQEGVERQNGQKDGEKGKDREDWEREGEEEEESDDKVEHASVVAVTTYSPTFCQDNNYNGDETIAPTTTTTSCANCPTAPASASNVTPISPACPFPFFVPTRASHPATSCAPPLDTQVGCASLQQGVNSCTLPPCTMSTREGRGLRCGWPTTHTAALSTTAVSSARSAATAIFTTISPAISAVTSAVTELKGLPSNKTTTIVSSMIPVTLSTKDGERLRYEWPTTHTSAISSATAISAATPTATEHETITADHAIMSTQEGGKVGHDWPIAHTPAVSIATAISTVTATAIEQDGKPWNKDTATAASTTTAATAAYLSRQEGGEVEGDWPNTHTVISCCTATEQEGHPWSKHTATITGVSTFTTAAAVAMSTQEEREVGRDYWPTVHTVAISTAADTVATEQEGHLLSKHTTTTASTSVSTTTTAAAVSTQEGGDVALDWPTAHTLAATEKEGRLWSKHTTTSTVTSFATTATAASISAQEGGKAGRDWPNAHTAAISTATAAAAAEQEGRPGLRTKDNGATTTSATASDRYSEQQHACLVELRFLPSTSREAGLRRLRTCHTTTTTITTVEETTTTSTRRWACDGSVLLEPAAEAERKEEEEEGCSSRGTVDNKDAAEGEAREAVSGCRRCGRECAAAKGPVSTTTPAGEREGCSERAGCRRRGVSFHLTESEGGCGDGHSLHFNEENENGGGKNFVTLSGREGGCDCEVWPTQSERGEGCGGCISQTLCEKDGDCGEEVSPTLSERGEECGGNILFTLGVREGGCDDEISPHLSQTAGEKNDTCRVSSLRQLYVSDAGSVQSQKRAATVCSETKNRDGLGNNEQNFSQRSIAGNRYGVSNNQNQGFVRKDSDACLNRAQEISHCKRNGARAFNERQPTPQCMTVRYSDVANTERQDAGDKDFNFTLDSCVVSEWQENDASKNTDGVSDGRLCNVTIATQDRDQYFTPERHSSHSSESADCGGNVFHHDNEAKDSNFIQQRHPLTTGEAENEEGGTRLHCRHNHHYDSSHRHLSHHHPYAARAVTTFVESNSPVDRDREAHLLYPSSTTRSLRNGHKEESSSTSEMASSGQVSPLDLLDSLQHQLSKLCFGDEIVSSQHCCAQRSTAQYRVHAEASIPSTQEVIPLDTRNSVTEGGDVNMSVQPSSLWQRDNARTPPGVHQAAAPGVGNSEDNVNKSEYANSFVQRSPWQRDHVSAPPSVHQLAARGFGDAKDCMNGDGFVNVLAHISSPCYVDRAVAISSGIGGGDDAALPWELKTNDTALYNLQAVDNGQDKSEYAEGTRLAEACTAIVHETNDASLSGIRNKGGYVEGKSHVSITLGRTSEWRQEAPVWGSRFSEEKESSLNFPFSDVAGKTGHLRGHGSPHLDSQRERPSLLEASACQGLSIGEGEGEMTECDEREEAWEDGGDRHSSLPSPPPPPRPPLPRFSLWRAPVSSSSELEDSDSVYTSVSTTDSDPDGNDVESDFPSSSVEDYDNVDENFHDFVSGLHGQYTSDRPSQLYHHHHQYHHRKDTVTAEFRSSRLRSCIQETILEADDESETADETQGNLTLLNMSVDSYRSSFNFSLPQSSPNFQAVSPLPGIQLWCTDQQLIGLSASKDATLTAWPKNADQQITAWETKTHTECEARPKSDDQELTSSSSSEDVSLTTWSSIADQRMHVLETRTHTEGQSKSRNKSDQLMTSLSSSEDVAPTARSRSAGKEMANVPFWQAKVHPEYETRLSSSNQPVTSTFLSKRITLTELKTRSNNTDQPATSLYIPGNRDTSAPLSVTLLQDLSDRLSIFDDSSFELQPFRDSSCLDDPDLSSSYDSTDISEEGSVYFSSATAEVRELARETGSSGGRTECIQRSLLYPQSDARLYSTSKASNESQWVLEKMKSLQKLLSDFESECQPVEQTLMDEMCWLEGGRGGDAAITSSISSRERSGARQAGVYGDLYCSFTRDLVEKRQNHVCPILEDRYMSVLRFKRFLRKKHNCRVKGHGIFRVRHVLDTVSESLNAVDNSLDTGNESFAENGSSETVSAENSVEPTIQCKGLFQITGSHYTSTSTPLPLSLTESCAHTTTNGMGSASEEGSSSRRPYSLNFSEVRDTQHRFRDLPNLRSYSTQSRLSEDMGESGVGSLSEADLLGFNSYSSTPTLRSLAKSRDRLPLPCVLTDEADARWSLSDSAYSTLSDATSRHVSDLDSSLRSTCSSRTDVTMDLSMDSDKMTSLSDVFDQLDVCEGEIDQALLDRLHVGHYKADTL